MSIAFATPELLILLAIVPVLALLPVLLRKKWRPAAMRFAGTGAVRQSKRGWKLRVLPFVSALRWIALALLIVAAARPQTSEAREIIHGEGVDIALALDISGSMSAKDFDPSNRLEAAKLVVGDFIDQREYDRIGLVVFASAPLINSPPTIDHDALVSLLEDVDLASRLGLQASTAMGMGLATATNMLKDSASKSKVVVLLTDGVNNEGVIDPLTAAAAAETLGIRVYTIAMGNPDGVVVTRRGAFGIQQTVTRYEADEKVLREIAKRTGGRFYLASDTERLQDIYEEINSLEKSEVEVSVFTQHDELARWMLLPGAVILLLELLARATILRTAP